MIQTHSDETILSYVNFKRQISGYNFIFAYRGKLSHALVKSLLKMAEQKIDALQEEVVLKKRIFAVMMNCLQTICADERTGTSDASSIFLISRNKNGFTVFTGRYLSEDTTTQLSRIIEELNLLSRDSLGGLHREKLKELQSLNDSFDIDQTILSLIDIARKSDQRINYRVEPGGNKGSFFSIQVQIN